MFKLKIHFSGKEGNLSSHFEGSKVALNVSTFKIHVPRIPARNTSSIFYPGKYITDFTAKIKLVPLSLLYHFYLEPTASRVGQF